MKPVQYQNIRQYLPFLLSLCSFILVFIATSKYGAGVTPDSVNYLSAAENFANGNGMQNFEGELYATWPPLYVWLLSLAGFAGINMLDFATFLNAIIFGLITLFAGKFFFRHLLPAYAAGATIAVAFGYPVFFVSKCVWTEPLFILLLLLSFWQFDQYLLKKSSQSFIWLCIVAALVPLQRYAGIVLPAAIAIAFILFIPNRRSYASAAVVAAVGYAPVLLWLVRNVLFSGDLTGARDKAVGGIALHYSDAFATLALWIGPFYKFPYEFQVWAGGFFALLTAAIFVILWKRGFLQFSVTEKLILVFSLLYMMLLAGTVMRYGLQPFNTYRLMIPLYVILVFFLFKSASAAATFLKKYYIKWLLYFLVAAFMAFHMAYSSYAAFYYSKSGAHGYNIDQWHHSEMMDYISKNSQKLGYPLHSNSPDAIWFHTGLSAKMLTEIPLAGAITVCYFNNGRGYLLNAEEIRQTATKEISFDDGSVFIIE